MEVSLFEEYKIDENITKDQLFSLRNAIDRLQMEMIKCLAPTVKEQKIGEHMKGILDNDLPQVINALNDLFKRLEDRVRHSDDDELREFYALVSLVFHRAYETRNFQSYAKKILEQLYGD